jgi:hypothetical protein
MTGTSFGPNKPTFREVDHHTRLNFLDTVLEKVRDRATPVEEIAATLNTGGIAISTFDTYRALEVAVLSDRQLGNKIELVREIGRYTLLVAAPLNDSISESLVSKAMQYKALLQICGIIEDGLLKV